MFKMRDIARRGPGTYAGSLDDENAMNRDPEANPAEAEPDADTDDSGDSFAASMGREAALNNRPRPRKLF